MSETYLRIEVKLLQSELDALPSAPSASGRENNAARVIAALGLPPRGHGGVRANSGPKPVKKKKSKSRK